MATDLVVSCQLEISPGVFLQLEDDVNGYWIEAGTFASRDITYRQILLNTPWTEGSVAVQSVRENIVEPLSIFVTGPDHYTFDQRVQTVTGALEQLAYQVVRVIGNSQETWDCIPAQYTIVTQQEYLVATMGLIRAQVPRQPAVTRVAV